jgi:hypothetical protein
MHILLNVSIPHEDFNAELMERLPGYVPEN